MGRSSIFHASLALSFVLPACGGPASGGPAIGGSAPLERKLALVGLELVGEDEALVPNAERGRYVPCRVIPGFPRPAFPPHPAGYLIVGIRGAAPAGREEILQSLEAWGPGETLHLLVRRNPYLEAAAEWWEAEVHLRHP